MSLLRMPLLGAIVWRRSRLTLRVSVKTSKIGELSGIPCASRGTMKPLAIVLAGLILSCGHVHAQNADSVAVARAVEAFHAALASGDSAGALALLSEDVLILESGGMETKADYRAGHLPADIAYARAVLSKRSAARITVLGDAAWVAGTSRTSGTYREREVNSAGAELIVLTRGASGWRIRAIHWSSRNVRPQPGD
jgi:ketosteroid isomerase-like protein